MAYQPTSWQLSLSVLCVFMAAACLSSDGTSIFDKVLGLGLVLPVSSLFVSISGVLLGRAGILLATTLAVTWMIAVAIG